MSPLANEKSAFAIITLTKKEIKTDSNNHVKQKQKKGSKQSRRTLYLISSGVPVNSFIASCMVLAASC